MPLTFHLPGGVIAYREVASSPSPKPKPAKKPAPVIQPAPPMPDPEPAPQKSFLETAVEAVDEVVRPKAKRGRKKTSSD